MKKKRILKGNLAAFVFWGLFCACQNEPKKQLLNIWESEFELDPSIIFHHTQNARNGYFYKRPKNFKEIVADSLQFDTITYKSEDNNATLVLFLEGELRRENLRSQEANKDALTKELAHLDDSIKRGKHRLSQNLKIIKSSHEKGHRLQYFGEKTDTEIIWGIELSEIPVCGDFVFKNLYFEYPKEQRAFYHPIGIEVLNSFGILRYSTLFKVDEEMREII